MPERFREMEKAALAKGNEVQPSEEEIRPSERGFLRRLREYPELQAKIETMLAIIENAGGDVEKAAEAERRIIEELQQMGNEVLHGWARRQQQKKEEEYNAKPGMNRKEKKPSIGSAAMLVDVLVGGSPTGGTCPVATVVISGNGASDQSVGSPEVKVSVG
jgi:chromosome segregation ATPase